MAEEKVILDNTMEKIEHELTVEMESSVLQTSNRSNRMVSRGAMKLEMSKKSGPVLFEIVRSHEKCGISDNFDIENLISGAPETHVSSGFDAKDNFQFNLQNSSDIVNSVEVGAADKNTNKYGIRKSKFQV